MKPFVFDATPLIYLGKVNLLDKIMLFPEDKFITKSVYREVVDKGKNRGETEAFLIEKLVKNGAIKLKNPVDKRYRNSLLENPKIHKGDADVLALAHELNGIALMDDDEARSMAEIEGIEHHGTVYLLLSMMKMELLSKEETLDFLNEIIHMGWRCSTELYAEILMTLK